jgi:serine/threonine protein kinase
VSQPARQRPVRRPRSLALNHELSDSLLAPRAFGPFRVLHQIGVGVLGPVYRAQAETDGALVAIKALRIDAPPEHAADVARDLTALVSAWPRHTGLAGPIAAGIEGETPWLALEHLESPTLDTWLREGRRLRVEDGLAGIAALAEAVDAAHAAGFVHGSLHPRDVFVDVQGVVRVTGFGLGPVLQRIGIRPAIRRPYSAPETIEGGAITPAADLFTLGVLAFEWLTRRRPAGLGAEAAAHFETAAAADEVAHARSIVAAMLAENPTHRPASALAFALALAQALTGGAADIFDHPPAAPAAPSPDEALRLFATQGTLWQAPSTDDLWREPQLDRRDDATTESVLAGGMVAMPLEPRDSEPSPSIRERSSVGDTIISSGNDDTVIHAAPVLGLHDDPSLHAEPAERDARISVDAPVTAPRFEPEVEMPAAAAGTLFGRAPVAATEPPAEASAPSGVVLALTLALGLAVGGAGGFLLGQRSASRAQEQAAAVPPLEEPRLASDPAGPPPASAAEPPPVVQEAAPAAPTSTTSAPPRSRAAAATGELIVRSMPARAAVVVNNVWRGRTPLTLRGLAFGTHTVRVVEKGYEPETRRVSLDGRVPAATVSVQLERTAPQRVETRPTPAPGATTGSLYIESRPTGAKVSVDGRLVGTTPLLIGDLAPGGRAIRLEHPGHRPWTTTVQITAGRRQRLAASLEEATQ